LDSRWLAMITRAHAPPAMTSAQARRGALGYMEERGIGGAPRKVPSWWGEEPEEETLPKGKGKSQKGKGKKKGKDKKKAGKGATKGKRGKKGKQKKGKNKEKSPEPENRRLSDSEGSWEDGAGSFTGRTLDERPAAGDLPPDGTILVTAASEVDWTAEEGGALGVLDRRAVTAVQRGQELRRIARETHEEIEQRSCMPCWVMVAIALVSLAVYIGTTVSAGEV
jgi:hypothetical protein